MSYTLYFGDYTYSSWSLRGWLLLHRFDVPMKTRFVDFASAEVADQLKHLFPARTVPTLVTPEGTVIWDSLAIAEELASRHPEAGIWPEDPTLRAAARGLAAEMHSGFMALRQHCPMNLRCAYADVTVPDEVLQDVARIDALWQWALERSKGPWLCGTYSAADAFFAPVAARIAGYGLSMSPTAMAYVAAHLADPAFRRWRAMGFAQGQSLPWYAKDFAQVPWPGPASRAAQAVSSGQPENDVCPYSGKPVTHLLEIDQRIFGVCNAFCRDKTVADPDAWPAFQQLLRQGQ